MKVFWAGEEASNINTQLEAFQFIARLHESLLVTSLTTIIFDQIRHGLISLDGIPIGHLLAAQQIQLPTFLKSREFWSPMSAYRTKSFKCRFSLGYLLLISAPFILVSGPLSAILLVPRLDWSSSLPVNLYPLVWNTSASRFWPDEVSASLIPPDCKGPTAYNKSSCPASAFETLTDWLNSGSLFSDGPKNITIPSISHAQRYLSVDQNSGSSITLASTLSSRIFEDLTAYWSRGKTLRRPANFNSPHKEPLSNSQHQKLVGVFNGNTELLKPLVRTDCHVFNVSEDNISILNNTNNPWSTTLEPLNLSYVDWARPTFTWSNVTLGDRGRVLGGIFTYSLNRTTASRFLEDCGYYCKKLLLCPVEASWAPVKIWMDSRSDDTVYQETPMARAFNNTSIGRTRPIVLQKDWADLLISAQVSSIRPANSTNSVAGSSVQNFSYIESFMMSAVDIDHVIFEPFPTNEWSGLLNEVNVTSVGFRPGGYAHALSIILTASVTEALSRLNYDNNLATWGYDVDSNQGFCPGAEGTLCTELVISNMTSYNASFSTGFKQGDWMQLDFRVQRYGWGWFSNSIMVHAALVILLLHAALTLIYLIFAFRSKDVAVAWGGMGGLLVLAINSLPSKELVNTSAGVEKGAIWKKMVKVREVDDGKRLSLVVDRGLEHDAKVGCRPQVDKKYE